MPRRRSPASDPGYERLAPLGDHRNLAERTYQYLFAAIYGLKIRPGEELNEVRLAQRLGVSVTPVREALLRLSGDGLVVREPQHPPRVVQLALKEIDELYDVRGVLESFAAAEAARHASESDIRHLASLQEDGKRFAEEGDPERYDAYNDDFHQTVMALAQNSLLVRTMQPIRVKIRLCMHATAQLPGRRFHGVTEHEEIIGRLAAHDGAGAGEAMRRHCAAAKNSYLENFAKLEESAVPRRRPQGRQRRAAR